MIPAPGRLVSVPLREVWRTRPTTSRRGLLRPTTSETAGFRDRRLGVEIYITHRAAKRAFDLLDADRASIEAEFGEPLDWHRMNDKKACRIAVYRTDLDPRDESQRSTQYEWFLDHMQRFAQAFGNRIRTLPLDNAAEADVMPPSAEAADG